MQKMALVLSMLLLFSLLALGAGCAQPAPSPAPTPAPAPAPSPAPTPEPAPAPSPSPIEGPEVQPGVRPNPPHHFWGQVASSSGEPAADVEVTAWINGTLRGSITTDADGQYGSDPLKEFPYYLVISGQDGEVIEFRVDGVVAEETRLGTLMEENENRYWQWQDLKPEWQAAYTADEVNGLDLRYTPPQ